MKNANFCPGGTIPIWIRDILREEAKKRGIPMSRLLWYAVDNELDAGNPFDYPIDEPTTPYIPHAYTTEAKLLYDFLLDYREGVDVGMIVVMRRQFGIPDRQTVLYALRELLEAKLVIKSKIKPRAKFFDHFGDNLDWIRLTSGHKSIVERQRKTLDEKLRKLNVKDAKLRHQEALLKEAQDAKKKL